MKQSLRGTPVYVSREHNSEGYQQSHSPSSGSAAGFVGSLLRGACFLMLPLVVVSALISSTGAEERLRELISSASSQRCRSVSIKGTVRSDRSDDFFATSCESKLVPFTLWTSVENRPVWKAEKPGCLGLSFEGDTIVVTGSKPREIDFTGREGAIGCLGWLGPLVHLDVLLDVETSLGRAHGTKWESTEWKDASGKWKRAICVNEQKPFQNSGAHSLFKIGCIREYIIDCETELVEQAKIYGMNNGKRVLLLEATSFEYSDYADETPEVASLFQKWHDVATQ